MNETYPRMKIHKRLPRRPPLIRTKLGKPMWYHDGPRALKKTKAQHSRVPTVAARTMCHHNRPMEIKAAPALYVVGENEIEN